MIRLGVTGTDTEVGKTFVSTLLLRAMRRRGWRIAAMKPVETGVWHGDARSDAHRLLVAAGVDDPLEDVRPVVLSEPLAPWVALTRSGGAVDEAALRAAFDRLCAGRDAILVEGAGGLLVPLTATLAWDGLFAAWGLDVVVVAGNRLGVINHTRLTVRAAEAAGLRVRGVVLNARKAGGGIAEATNREALSELLHPLPVVPLPWFADRRDEARLLDIAEENGIGRLLEG